VLSIIVLSIFLTVSTPQITAHPGRTADDGCHYCRTNCDKWGEVEGARHCHGGGEAAPVQEVQQFYTPPTNTPRPWPTWTPAPTKKPLPTWTPVPTATPRPTSSPKPSITLTPTITQTAQTVTPSTKPQKEAEVRGIETDTKETTKGFFGWLFSLFK
jgi:hypothetical protein